MEREQIAARAAAVVDAYNAGDADGVVRFCTDASVLDDVVNAGPLTGKAALRGAAARYMTAFPDLHVTISSETIDGNRIVQEWVATGTHEGELMGIAPTHKPAEFHGCAVTNLDENGMVTEWAQYWNPLSLLWQLGVVDPGVLAVP